MRTMTLPFILTALWLSAMVGTVGSAQPLTDSPQAQALVDQALGIWADTRTQPVGDRALQAKALLEQVVANYAATNQAAAALRHLAYGHARKGLKDQAQAYWDRLFQEYPTSQERGHAWMDQARLLADQRQHEKALPLLENVLNEFPKTELEPEALFLKGDYLWVLDRPKEALAPLERLVADYGETKIALRAHYVLGYIKAIQVVDASGAMAHLVIVIANEDIDPERVAWSLFLMAECNARLWNHAAAMAQCEDVINNFSQCRQPVISAQALLKWVRWQVGAVKGAK